MTSDQESEFAPAALAPPPPLPQVWPQMPALPAVPPPPPPPPPPPRVWPAIVVPVVATFAAAMASIVAIVVPAAMHGGPELLQDEDALMQWIAQLGATPGGFLLLVLPGQLTFLAAALLAAWVSPEPTRRRLNLVRPTVPTWALVVLLVPGTLFAGICGDLLTTLLFGDDWQSEHLKMLYDLFRGPTGAFLVLVTLAISVLPGFSEEMLFRGYCQSRLLKRMPPLAAIAISSVAFAAAHLDPVHVVAVIPLGIWLGVVAWLTRSILPAIVCHAANNAVAVLLTNAGVADVTDRVRLDAEGLALIGVSGTFAALAVWVMVRTRRQPSLAPVLGGEGQGEGPIVEQSPLTIGPSPHPSPPRTGERE